MDILGYRIMFCDLESLFSTRCNTFGLGRGRSFGHVLVNLIVARLNDRCLKRFGGVTVSLLFLVLVKLCCVFKKNILEGFV